MKWIDDKIEKIVIKRMENYDSILDSFEAKLRKIRESLESIEQASKDFVSARSTKKKFLWHT